MYFLYWYYLTIFWPTNFFLFLRLLQFHKRQVLFCLQTFNEIFYSNIEQYYSIPGSIILYFVMRVYDLRGVQIGRSFHKNELNILFFTLEAQTSHFIKWLKLKLKLSNYVRLNIFFYSERKYRPSKTFAMTFKRLLCIFHE